MNNSNKFAYNIIASIHNHSLIAQAEKLINNFINDDSRDISIIYAVNPDGTTLKLQEGVRLISVDGHGIVEED